MTNIILGLITAGIVGFVGYSKWKQSKKVTRQYEGKDPDKSKLVEEEKFRGNNGFRYM